MNMYRTIALTLTAAAAVAFCASSASADPEKKYQAKPWVFIGKANECGNPYPAGSNIVTSGWLEGMGLPDDGTTANPDGKKDDQDGLLLNKNGPTPNCSAAGAEIKEIKKGTPLTELGFDYRLGGHCGAGAPRFNVVTSAGNFYFVGGCQAGTHTGAPQDPTQWGRVRFTPADFFGSPPFTFGTPVKSIDIVFDEGTDTANNDTEGVGLAVLDNIDINGFLITEGEGGVKH
jgi:hypothetical protein